MPTPQPPRAIAYLMWFISALLMFLAVMQVVTAISLGWWQSWALAVGFAALAWLTLTLGGLFAGRGSDKPVTCGSVVAVFGIPLLIFAASVAVVVFTS